jgi:hypothetical protein
VSGHSEVRWWTVSGLPVSPTKPASGRCDLGLRTFLSVSPTKPASGHSDDELLDELVSRLRSRRAGVATTAHRGRSRHRSCLAYEAGERTFCAAGPGDVRHVTYVTVAYVTPRVYTCLMTEISTPVGQHPSTGGPLRIHATDAERTAAWRARQKARRTAGEPGAAHPALELAPASLAAVVDRLRVLFDSQRVAVVEQLAQVDAAVEVLGDPEAVEAALEEIRARAAKDVAEAVERVAQARQDARRAQAEVGAAIERAEEADAAGREAWAQVESLRGALADVQASLAEARAEGEAMAQTHRGEVERLQANAESAALAHVEALALHQREAATELAERDRLHERALEELTTAVEAKLAAAREAQARAEGAAQSLEAEIERLREEAADAARRAAERDQRTRADIEARCRAEAAGALARVEGDCYAAQARLEATQELAHARLDEIERLSAQLRSALDRPSPKPAAATRRRTSPKETP